MNLEDFATEEHPLRCSSLPMLITCPAQAAMRHMLAPPRDSGTAADTGTAIHLAIDRWHHGVGETEALEQVRSRLPEFPKADLEEVGKMFHCYAVDPRNVPEVVVATEQELRFALRPHPYDPTQRDIVLKGTCDQIRSDGHGGLELWDIKTGKPDGWTMLHEYAPQLAAYTLAAQVLHPTLTCGGIIRTRGYIRRGVEPPESSPSGVFFCSTLSQQDCQTILYRVRLNVALIRRGEPIFGPGEHCGFCPFGGIGDCIERGSMIGLQLCAAVV